ncbi:MAG: GntR family transcriptional regulator [Clostridium sp.]|nr:GntR family transcriptional regulator [Clostridium sp.]
MEENYKDNQPPLSSQVYTKLKNQIVNLSIMPGQILAAQKLSADLNVSRTPVREALVRLTEEGLLTPTSGSKFKVTEITWKYIFDLYEMRKSLETLSIKGISNTISTDQLQELYKLTESMNQHLVDKDAGAFFMDDLSFHDALVRFYGNELVLSWYLTTHNQQQRVRFLTAGLNSRMNETIIEHANIIACLEKHNGSDASALLEKHLDNVIFDLKTVQSDHTHPIHFIIKP